MEWLPTIVEAALEALSLPMNPLVLIIIIANITAIVIIIIIIIITTTIIAILYLFWLKNLYKIIKKPMLKENRAKC